MGVRSDGIRKAQRGGKPHWIIDFRYRDKDGRGRRYRRDASVQSAAGARAEAERLKRLAASTGSLDVRPKSTTFGEFIDETFRPLHMATRCRPSTRNRYEDLLRQGILVEFGERPLDGSWALAVRSFAAKLAARGVLVRPHLTLVRTVLRSAVECGAIDVFPALPALPRPSRKLPDAPSDEHVAKVLAVATGWLHTAVALVVYAGLRMGEVRALEVRDVDFDRGRILVRRAFSANEVLTPKSGHDRVVPLAPELRDALAETVRSKPPGVRIVVNRAGRTPGRQHVLAVLKRLEEKHGLRAWSFHALRHYFCTTLIRRGASVEAVRLLAGHSKLDVTQRYVHANAADLEAAIARLTGN